MEEREEIVVDFPLCLIKTVSIGRSEIVTLPQISETKPSFHSNQWQGPVGSHWLLRLRTGTQQTHSIF